VATSEALAGTIAELPDWLPGVVVPQWALAGGKLVIYRRQEFAGLLSAADEAQLLELWAQRPAVDDMTLADRVVYSRLIAEAPGLLPDQLN